MYVEVLHATRIYLSPYTFYFSFMQLKSNVRIRLQYPITDVGSAWIKSNLVLINSSEATGLSKQPIAAHHVTLVLRNVLLTTDQPDILILF